MLSQSSAALAAEEAPVHELVYRCGPVAKRFHADRDSRVKLLIGPFGTGKTSSAAYDQMMCQSARVMVNAEGVKRSRFAVVRNTFPQLRDTTMKTFLEWYPPPIYGRFNQTEKIYKARFEPREGDVREVEILFRALDIEKDVRNLLSLELTGAWIDEAREINNSVFTGVLGRIGRFPSLKDSGGINPFLCPPQVVLTTNYPSREHFLYRDFVAKPISGYSIYEQGQDENRHNLRPGYYDDLEHDYRDRPDLLKTLVRGQWGVTVRGKRVYSDQEFDHKTHVSDVPLLPVVLESIQMGGGRIIVRCWDNTGLSPAAAITYLHPGGQWLIFQEFIGEDEGIVEFGTSVKEWCNQEFPTNVKYRDIGDPAGKIRDSRKKSPKIYLQEECGIIIEDGIQTFKIRRESVVSRLHHRTHGLLIDPSCVRLIDGFEGGYAYPEITATGMFGDEPIKNEYSHIHDSIQYGATRLFYSGKSGDSRKRGFSNWNNKPDNWA